MNVGILLPVLTSKDAVSTDAITPGKYPTPSYTL